MADKPAAFLPRCSSRQHVRGPTAFYDGTLSPVLAASGRAEVLDLRPECITPQIQSDRKWGERVS